MDLGTNYCEVLPVRIGFDSDVSVVRDSYNILSFKILAFWKKGAADTSVFLCYAGAGCSNQFCFFFIVVLSRGDHGEAARATFCFHSHHFCWLLLKNFSTFPSSLISLHNTWCPTHIPTIPSAPMHSLHPILSWVFPYFVWSIRTRVVWVEVKPSSPRPLTSGQFWPCNANQLSDRWRGGSEGF